MRTKWRLVNYNGNEYAKYGYMTFRCCIKGIQPNGWIWIKEIDRYVNSKCIERR